MKNATTHILEFTGIPGKVKIWIYIFTLILLSVSWACGTTLPTAAKIAQIPTQLPIVEIFQPHIMQVCEDRTMPVYDEPDGFLTGQVFGYLDTFEAVYVNADWLYLTQGGYIEADYICEWTAVEVTPVVMQGVVTGDPLNIREFATTDSKSLGVLAKGTPVEVGALVKNDNPNCPAWYPYKGAWLCADFVSVK